MWLQTRNTFWWPQLANLIRGGLLQLTQANEEIEKHIRNKKEQLKRKLEYQFEEKEGHQPSYSARMY